MLVDPIALLLSYSYLIAFIVAVAAALLAYGLWHLIKLHDEIRIDTATLHKSRQERTVHAEHLLGPILFYLEATQTMPWQRGSLRRFLYTTYGEVFAERYCAEIADECTRRCMEASNETEKVPAMEEV